jgi:hypothetical protein
VHETLTPQPGGAAVTRRQAIGTLLARGLVELQAEALHDANFTVSGVKVFASGGTRAGVLRSYPYLTAEDVLRRGTHPPLTAMAFVRRLWLSLGAPRAPDTS